MIKVTTEFMAHKYRESNVPGDLHPESDEITIKMRNHPFYNDEVIIEIDGNEYAVYADDLRSAIYSSTTRESYND